MKKCFVLFLFSLSVFVIKAQTGIGVKGGFSSYALTGDDKSFFQSFLFGAVGNIKISGLLHIQAEVLRSKQGNEFELDDEVIGIYLNYINVPVMLQIVTKEGLILEAGPGIGFLSKAVYKVGNNPEEEAKQDFKSKDFFLGIGAGYRHKTGFGIGFRYNIGMANISAVNGGETKNTGGGISLSYLFSAKRKTEK